MGIVLTLAYIVTALLTPYTVFGSFGEYHPLIFIALAAICVSFPKAGGHILWRLPQTYGLIALILIIPFSIVLGGWLGGAAQSLLGFIPDSIVVFFIILNFKTKRHLQMLIAALSFVAAFVIFQGYTAVRNKEEDSPYVYVQGTESGEYLPRIRGQGIINDPNDLSQFLAALIPCLWVFSTPGNRFRNLLLALPASVILYGMYLSHSRGGMVALLVGSIVAFRKKIGVIPALVAGGIVFVGLNAAGWSGGRDVSAAAGSDRVEAWSVGLQMIRTHPLFGVGFMHFGDYYFITAHNTIIVCAAEIGLVGLFSWLMLVVPTIRDNAVTSAQSNVDSAPLPAVLPASIGNDHNMWMEKSKLAEISEGRLLAREQAAEVESFNQRDEVISLVGGADPLAASGARWTCQAMTVSLLSMLAAGWFLSRSFTLVLFIFVGMAIAAYQIALQNGVAPPPLPMGKAAKYASISGVALVAVVYVIARFSH